MKAAQFLVRALEQEGVEVAFGIHGSALTPLIDEVTHRSSIRPVLVRHEEGAAFMADGYARFSGRLGVCWGTSGPGTTNLLTGLATSLVDAVPVLAIGGQVPTSNFHRGAFQESTSGGVDSVALLRAVTKFAEIVSTPAQFPVLLRKAIRVALTGRRGPVALVIPRDCLEAEIQGAPGKVFSYRVQNRVFDARMVKQAAERLAKAKRPAILVGTGVSRSRASQELAQLAQLTGAAVATTPKAKGSFPEDDPLSLGVLGLGGHPTSAGYILEHADLLLAVGTSLGQLATNNYDARFDSLPLIHVDMDPEEIGKNIPVDIGLVGDAQVILKELIKAVMDRGAGGNVVARREYLRRYLSSRSRYIEPERMEQETNPILPQRAVRVLRSGLPRDAIVMWDSGCHNLWGVHYFPSYQPRTFVYSPSFGAMGYGVSACVGAKMAMPDRLVVSICGDGGFLMNGMEVSTAVNLGIQVIWVVFNNAGLGMVGQGDTVAVGRDTGTSIGNVDIAGIAKGLGARAFRARTSAELTASLDRAREVPGPSVIDLRIDAAQVPPVPVLRPELRGVV